MQDYPVCLYSVIESINTTHLSGGVKFYNSCKIVCIRATTRQSRTRLRRVKATSANLNVVQKMTFLFGRYSIKSSVLSFEKGLADIKSQSTEGL